MASRLHTNRGVSGSADKTSSRKVYSLLTFLVGLYLSLLAVMVVREQYGFVWKTVVVPAFFLVALLAGRGLLFVKDWGVFLSLVVLFDCLRGLIFALVTRFELPCYMNYAIEAERFLGRGKIFTFMLQEWWGSSALAPALDKLFLLVHASHFFVFLLFGLIVWIFRPEGFRDYSVGMLAVMYGGGIFYLLIPTVPPWMAANDFGVLPGIRHISSEMYSAAVPALLSTFDVNPIAAMPSLHAALPTFCALVGFRHFRWRAIPAATYAFLVYVSIIYLGEHYLVDVLAGMALAIMLYILMYARGGLQWPYSAVADRLLRRDVPERHRLVGVVVCSMAIVAGSLGIGLMSAELRRPFHATSCSRNGSVLTRASDLAHSSSQREWSDRKVFVTSPTLASAGGQGDREPAAPAGP